MEVSMQYSFNKDSEGNVSSELKYGGDGSLLDMCEGISKLVEDVLEQFADQHPTVPKERVAEIVKNLIIENVTKIVDDKYNMDDLFERTILESNKKEEK